jgi:hypothetical protein
MNTTNLTLNLYRVILQNDNLKLACILYNASDSLPINLDTLLSSLFNKPVDFQE